VPRELYRLNVGGLFQGSSLTINSKNLGGNEATRSCQTACYCGSDLTLAQMCIYMCKGGVEVQKATANYHPDRAKYSVIFTTLFMVISVTYTICKGPN
jgi:hypothetical protein